MTLEGTDIISVRGVLRCASLILQLLLMLFITTAVGIDRRLLDALLITANRFRGWLQIICLSFGFAVFRRPCQWRGFLCSCRREFCVDVIHES